MGSNAYLPFTEPLWLSRQVSPYYTKSHRQLQKIAREYVDTHILPFSDEWERQGFVPPEVIAEHSRQGYMATSVFPLAKEYLNGQQLPGGIRPEDWDGFHDLIVIDEVARCGYLGVIWALACGNSIGAPPLVHFGNAEQKQRFLPAILNGSIRFCLAVTEPDAGSDVAGITTTAERRGDKYIVNGAKKWITNGIFADYCTAAVRTGGPGKGGVSALIIPLKVPGVTCRKLENSGVSASDFNHERLWLACTSLRLARCCIEDAYKHGQVRETFGKPLLANQVIRAKFSASGRKVDSATAWMEQLVYMEQVASRGQDGGRDLYMGGLFANLKVLCGQTLEFVNREMQQVMGGLGYSRGGRGGRVEQISRDVRVMIVGGGSEEILSELSVAQEQRAMAKL